MVAQTPKEKLATITVGTRLNPRTRRFFENEMQQFTVKQLAVIALMMEEDNGNIQQFMQQFNDEDERNIRSIFFAYVKDLEVSELKKIITLFLYLDHKVGLQPPCCSGKVKPGKRGEITEFVPTISDDILLKAMSSP